MSTETTRSRQERIHGKKNLARLQRRQVGVVGVGLLGGEVIFQLGLLQIPLLLIDPDTVDAENLANQSFPAERVGDAKVVVRRDQLAALSPATRVSWRRARVEDVGLGALGNLALLVTGLDSRISRVRVAEIAQKLGLPWLDLAVDGSGERLQGTVTYWDPRVEDAACYACRYDDDEVAVIRGEGRGPGCPSWAKTDAPVTTPTLMASPFGSVVAGFGADWAIRSLLGQAADVANTQLQIFGGDTPRIRELAFARSANCPLPHVSLGNKLVRVASGSIGELYARATRDLGAEPDALRFHHRFFVTDLYCPTEGRDWEFPRLTNSIHSSELECRACGPGATLVPQGLSDQLVTKHVERFGAVSWSDIGLPRADVVTATCGDREIHYVVGRA